MHFSRQQNHAALRLLILWAGLTCAYLAAVTYRTIALREQVELPTYAGFSAVAAVWFALFYSIHPREVLRAGAITSLLGAIALNATIIARSYMVSRSIPVPRVIFTLLLFAGLVSTTLQSERHLDHKENE